MDSHGYAIASAQGQDFNFTWFMHGGVRYRLTDRVSASLGLYFQHISNGGMDPVNPGVDAISRRDSRSQPLIASFPYHRSAKPFKGAK